jgi:O-antigen ligase
MSTVHGYTGVPGGLPAFGNLYAPPRGAASRSSPPSRFARWSFTAHPLAVLTYYGLCILAACNGFALLARFNRFYVSEAGARELPIFPVATLFTIIVVLAFTKERSRGTYFWFAWSYWAIYILFGFAGSYQVTGFAPYTVMELIVKNWIGLIGFPWLAFRVISPDKIPRFQAVMLSCFAVGGLLSVAQALQPETFDKFVSEAGRGGGFWMNPNTCGLVLLMGFFLTLTRKWEYPKLMMLIRIALVAGLLFTYSRTAIIGLFMAGVVFSIAYGRAGRAVKVLLIGIVTGVIIFMLGTMVESGTIPIENKALRERILKITEIVTGKFATQGEYDTRTPLWSAAIKQVINRGGLVLGTGHGSMERAVEHAGSFLAPHNDYIYVWGNSGLPGLFAYLTLLGMFFWQASKCRDPQMRAGIMGAMTVFVIYAVFGHSMFAIHSMGPILAIISLWLYYGQLPDQPVGYAGMPFRVPPRGMPAFPPQPRGGRALPVPSTKTVPLAHPQPGSSA